MQAYGQVLPGTGRGHHGSEQADHQKMDKPRKAQGIRGKGQALLLGARPPAVLGQALKKYTQYIHTQKGNKRHGEQRKNGTDDGRTV